MNLFKHSRSGDIFELVTTAKHTENQEELVIYKNFAKTENDVVRTWARPVDNFYAVVENNVERFVPIVNIDEIFTESEIAKLKEAINTPDKCNDSVVKYNADYFQKYLED